MTIRVGINGFGRIGRNFFRAAKLPGADIDFVAVNDLGSLETMAHLLKYDSVLGTLPNEITAVDGGISVDGDVLKVSQRAQPCRSALGRPRRRRRHRVDRRLQLRDKASAHLDGGAPFVIVSAPCGGSRQHLRGRSQRGHLRSGQGQGRLERVVHDQLLRADGQGARRQLRSSSTGS